MSPSQQRASILVVEDDLTAATAIGAVLEASGYRVWRAQSGAEARRMVDQVRPALIVLDVMLPDVDGLVLCSTLKLLTDAPILVCSGTIRKRDAVLALKLGADDFIAKPFDVDDLEARVGVLLRRPGRGNYAPAEQEEGEMKIGRLAIDRSRRRVTLGGAALQLTPTEYRLLSALASRPDEILSREELAQRVWGYQDASSGRTIDVHIRRLRVKLAGGPVPAPAIVSVRGFGYKLSPIETAAPSTSAP